MALTLQDFNKSAGPEDEEVNIDSFQPVKKPSPAANPATINTIASHGAVLSPDGNLDSAYTSISSQLNIGANSDTLNGIIRSWEENDVAGTMEALRETLSDPNIPDEQKAIILDEFQTSGGYHSLTRSVGISAIMADDAGENGEQEDIRVRLAKAYNEVDEYNAWAQSTINALNNASNPGFIENTKAFVASLIPFVDAATQATFNQAFEVGDTNIMQTMLLLGESRNQVREAFMKMPIEARQTAVQNMIKVIKSSNGSVANDTLTLQKIQNLERMITPGGYGNVERYLDDVFSVLDATFFLSLLKPIGGAVKGIGRGIAGAKAAAGGTRASEEVAARAARSGEAVDKLAPLPANRSLVVIPEEPAAVPLQDWTSSVDEIIDSLPVEPTSKQIEELRVNINNQINNGGGFDIDNVIDNSSITDQLNSSQINDVRQRLGTIRDRRSEYLNATVPSPVATVSEVRARHISSNVQQTSVAMTFKDTNISKARALHQAVVADKTGRASQIAYGSTRDDALAHDYLPEIGGNGRVQNKIEYDDVATPNPTVVTHASKMETASWADASEKAAAQKRVVNDWKNVVGVSNRSAMASVEHLKPSANFTDEGVRLNQIYGPKDGGFSNAFTGLDEVRAALRDYGVKDSDITVLSRQKDGTYAPANGGDYTNGDFLIQVKYDYNLTPKDVEYSGFDVSPIWTFIAPLLTFGKVKGVSVPDIRFLNKEGGLTQQIVPKSANIDPRAYTPAVAAANKASGLQRQFLNVAKEFAKRWGKLDKAEQIRVDAYIRKANLEEIPFSPVTIRSAGISEEGLDVLARWKEMQDTLYVLENLDVARGLKDRGYKMFEHRGSNTRLVVEPAGKSTIRPNAQIYDVATDSFIILSQKNIDDIYEAGGEIVKPRRGHDIDGRNIEYILSPNDGTGGFSRTIRDDDKILNYRHGYYHVKYTDPYYITKRDPETGKVSTIARAEGNREARLEAKRLNETKDGFEYAFKRDNALESFDDNLDVATNFGRSAQRLRGKQLERVRGSNDKGIGDTGVESPFDSLTRSIASISQRTSFRNVVDAERRRWMKQFKHLTTNGQFPDSVAKIKDGDNADAARHAYRHIEQLTDGYANTMDDISRGFFNRVSEVAGNKGWGWVDKLASKATGGRITASEFVDKAASKAARVSPSASARLIAFKLFLAANPIRQLPLQALPAIPIMASLNPTGMPKVFKQLGIVGAWHHGVDLTVTNKIAKYGLNMEETRDMLEAYELSGMTASVNAHSYLSNTMGRIADKGWAQKAASVAGKPLEVSQSIGFDLGEQSLMTLVWLSEYDRLTKKLGRTKLTGTERDQLVGKVRALTGDMNRGGDMPYNSNSFSVLMQFLQTPHKISSGLLLGHTGLTGFERAKLAAGYTVAFGVPGIGLVDMFIDKILPADNPELRDIVKGGLTNTLFNSFFSSMTGQKVGVDISGSVQPFSLEPMVEFIGGLVSNSLQDVVNGTASVSLFADGGRINNFARAAVDWLAPGSYENVDEVAQLYTTFFQLFSGVSNTMKAKMILDSGKIVTNSGQTVDEDVSYVEAMMKAAGFQTLDEVYHWAGNMAKWEVDGSAQRDVEKLVDDLFIKLTRQGDDVGDMEQYTAILRTASSVFNGNQEMLNKVSDYYKMKLRSTPEALYRMLLTSGLYSKDDVIKILNNSNIPSDKRKLIMDLYEIAGSSYGN